jgi:hypothetical protein
MNAMKEKNKNWQKKILEVLNKDCMMEKEPFEKKICISYDT